MRSTDYLDLSTVAVPAPEDPDAVCARLGIDSYLFHRQLMQVRGICVPWMSSAAVVREFTKADEFHLASSHPRTNIGLAVPAKLAVYNRVFTPYRYDGNALYYDDHKVLGEYDWFEVPLPEGNHPRYLKGFSFPHLGTDSPYHALRFNPRTSGYCPGRCAFCHRAYSQRTLANDRPTIIEPDVLVRTVINRYGSEVLKKVRYITVVTELFGRDDKFLDYLEKLFHLLVENGFPVDGEFDCIAQDVRSSDGLKRLYRILSPKMYQYTLEIFSNREINMGRYKGLPIAKVIEILERAREVGFDDIQLNYVAGIDSLRSFEKGLLALHDRRLVDSIGFNVLTSFFSDQILLRNREAWSVDYYHAMTQMIRSLGIKFYKPESFEMGGALPLPSKYLQARETGPQRRDAEERRDAKGIRDQAPPSAVAAGGNCTVAREVVELIQMRVRGGALENRPRGKYIPHLAGESDRSTCGETSNVQEMQGCERV